MKECFGTTGAAQIKWIDKSQKHYIAVDEEKLQECETCEDFARCSWQTTLGILKRLLSMIDDVNHKLATRL